MSKFLESTQTCFAAMLLAEQLDVPSTLFAGDVELLTERIRIYRGNLQAIWSNSLRNAYPVIDRLVGSHFFDQLAILYGQQFPSLTGDLNQFGQHFPEFLEQEPSVKAFPYFASVAQLEWLVHQAYYCADAEILCLANFLNTCGQSASEFGLRFHPAASLFRANDAAVQIYLAHMDGSIDMSEVQLQITMEQISFALISRAEWEVEVLTLTHAEFVALSSLSQGSMLEAALDAALAIDAKFDIAAALSKWFSAGAFSSFYQHSM